MKWMFGLLVAFLSWGATSGYAEDQSLDFPPNADLDLTFVINSIAAGNDSAVAGGFLKIRNVTRIPVVVLHPESRGALTYFLTDAAGNVVTPEALAKEGPPLKTVTLPPGAALTYDLGRLSFTTETGQFHYSLAKGGRYSIIVTYRPLGPQGPGFVSKEVRQTVD